MVFCDVCNVEVPEAQDALEVHESGKKHIRLVAVREAAVSLASRSVFVKSKKEDLTSELLRQTFGKFGSIDRVLCKGEPATHGIIEFVEEEAAAKALEHRHLDGGQVQISVQPRKVKFTKAPAPEEVSCIDSPSILEKAALLDSFLSQLDYCIEEISITKQDMERRLEVAQRLQNALSEYFYEPEVRVFGSSITQLGTRSSDMDACVMLSRGNALNRCSIDIGRDKFTLLTCDPQTFKGRKVKGNEVLRLSSADRVRFVCKVLNEVRKECSWLTAQRPVLDAKVPIVRFMVDSSLLVDLSVDNALGCAKSEYIRDLVLADPTGNLRRIMLGFRFWAVSGGLFDPPPGQHKGQFNAYMLYLIVIAYLQSENLLPRFDYSNGLPVEDGGWRIDYTIQPFDLAAIDITTVFHGLFVWLVQFDVSQVITLHTGPIPVEQFKPSAPEGFVYGHIHVQDPLERSHNVTQNLAQKSLAKMRHRMMLSIASLKRNKVSFVQFASVADDTPNSSGSKQERDFATVMEFPPVADVSADSLKEAFDKLMTQIVYAERKEDPVSKRRRMEEEGDQTICELGTFVVKERLWIGRRAPRKRLAREGPHGLELEAKVSSELLQKCGKANDAILEFTASLIPGDKPTFGFALETGTQTDLNDMVHSIQMILPSLVDDLFSNAQHGEDVQME